MPGLLIGALALAAVQGVGILLQGPLAGWRGAIWDAAAQWWSMTGWILWAPRWLWQEYQLARGRRR